MKYCCTNSQRKDTCYFEFQKGKFNDKHWLSDSLCLNADIFDDLGLYEFFSKVLSEFNYYGITEIDKEKWEQIKSESKKSGCAVKDVIDEIDSWINSSFDTIDKITILGI